MLLANLIGGWEVVFLVALALVLYGVRHLPELLTGLKRGIHEFINALHDVSNEIRGGGEAAHLQNREKGTHSLHDDWYLWLARGLDVGRIPFAPGTFGSLVGLLWFLVLVVPGSFTVFIAGCLVGIFVSVKCCGEAERILGKEDPGEVVLDEIVAIPICFVPWLIAEVWQHGAVPLPDAFLTGNGLWKTLGLYVLFRVFDIWKPWPVRQSQGLPGGIGVTADDVLAACYVAVLSLFFVP